MKYCHQCGTQLSNEDNFCLECGQDLNDRKILNYSKPKKSAVLPIILSLAILILVAVIFFIVLQPTESPSSVVSRCFDAVNRMDINGMLDCIEPDAAGLIKGVTGLIGDSFGVDAENLFAIAPGLNSMFNYNEQTQIAYEIVREEISNNTATVYVKIAPKDESMSQQEIPVPCKKINGRWYLAAM